MAGRLGHLRIWNGGERAEPTSSTVDDCAGDWQAEMADRLYTRETFRKPRRGTVLPEAFTLAWYEQIAQQRYARHGYWIPSLLEFRRHSGETLLALGEGLGTDWAQFARHGARVIVCSPSQEQLELVRANCEFQELEARFLHGTPHCLPIESDSVDVACIQGLLHEIDNPWQAIDEVYRVLRPGGKVIAVAPARYDARFWYSACFPLARWLRPDSESIPGATTARALRQAFNQFSEHRVYKRHLRRADMPHLWRFMPLPVMERLMGSLLVLKAFKPLSAARPVAAAAA